MSNQTAIAPYNQFKDLLKKESVQERFRQLLDKRAPEFLASLLSLVSADSNLLACEPTSILAAAAKAAILRLPISKELGFAYIVPFKREATFVIGYKGLVQLAIRTGQYVSINATEIYEGEELIVDRLTGTVKLNGRRSGDQVTGYVAYFKLRNGFEKYLAMDREAIERHATRYSKSYGNQKSAWTTNFDEMGKKTVLRLLLGKYGLLSIEMMDQDAGEAPLLGDDPRLAVPSFDVDDNPLEGELRDVDPEPEQPQPDSTPEPAAEAPAPAQEQLPLETNGKPEPKAAYGPDGKRMVPAGWIQHAIEEKLVRDSYGASGRLSKADPVVLPDDAPIEQVATWLRLYQGWRDAGKKSDQCAELANRGQVP